MLQVIEMEQFSKMIFQPAKLTFVEIQFADSHAHIMG